MADSTTATCFGGPLDRQVIRATYSPFICPIPRQVRLTDFLDPSPTGPSFPTGRYDRQQFRYVIKGKPMIWDAWCYDGGWIEDEPVTKHIELAMRLMYELARVWNGIPYR